MTSVLKQQWQFLAGCVYLCQLASILYLGALTIKNVLFEGRDLLIMGNTVDPLWIGIIALGVFAAAYSVSGGLMSVAITDVVQVIFLIGGGLVTTYIALQYLSDSGNVFDGFITLTERAPEKFDMILSKDNPQYINLPGIGFCLAVCGLPICIISDVINI